MPSKNKKQNKKIFICTPTLRLRACCLAVVVISTDIRHSLMSSELQLQNTHKVLTIRFCYKSTGQNLYNLKNKIVEQVKENEK